MKQLGQILALILAFTSIHFAQNNNCLYFPMEIEQSWQYSSEEYPDSLTSVIVDTATINGHLYYSFAPYGSEATWHRYWLRPEIHKVFALNTSDSTEYILFDFESEINQSWPIPAVATPPTNQPINQCDWGSNIHIISRTDTVQTQRSFINCVRFSHRDHPCYDAGILTTWFARDFGMVKFAQITEGGVLDWTLVTVPPDTINILGTYTNVGNPCLTIPCLPGIVSAISKNDTQFVLTSNEVCYWNGNLTWGNYSPQLGDSIQVRGIVTKRMDAYARDYFTCEITDLTKYSATNLRDSWNSKLPTNDFLSTNYPNPFNPLTTFKYSISESGTVMIVLYDARGREVKNLLNEFKEQGNYELLFDGSNLSSGIYYYRLITVNSTFTKSMLLIK